MRLIPPSELPYGELAMDEVYFEHDGPRFFALRAERTGMRLLALCVDEDEEAGTVTYIYLALSLERFQRVRGGSLKVRQAFELSNRGDIWQVIADYHAEPPANRVSPLDAVPSKWLPDADARLDLPTPTAPLFFRTELARQARESHRSLLAIELDPNGTNVTELRLRLLSRLGNSLQDTLDAVAQEEQGERTTSGSVQSAISSEVQVSVYGIRAASFVLLLAVDGEGRLFERSEVVEGTFRRLIGLTMSAAAPETLLSVLRDYSPRVRGKFKQLLEAATDARSGIAIHTAPLGAEAQSASLDRSQVSLALRTISEISPDRSELPLARVALTALNTHRHTFEVWDAVQGRYYTGALSKEARELVNDSRVGSSSFYSVMIEVLTDFASPSIEKYRLLSILELEP